MPDSQSERDLAELDDRVRTQQCRTVRDAIAERFKNCQTLPKVLPPHLLALLVELNDCINRRDKEDWPN
jgi:hypothetical protein